ncbi:MAG: YqeG family HAD IIIA-type phosphatase [Clostridiales bacterium]|nr:YqeG family HAD IIIA-type phosphatase [Clostridiales bacterium]
MSFPLVPKQIYNSIYELEGEVLAAAGITLLLADLDNTLVPYGVAEPDESVRAWTASLQNSGITLFILSNSRRPKRVRRFSEALGVPFIGHAGKPKRASFRRAMEHMGATPEQTAIVGDQIFTDIWGGNNAGVTPILVKPIAFGNPLRSLRYAAETPFLLMAGKEAWNDERG